MALVGLWYIRMIHTLPYSTPPTHPPTPHTHPHIFQSQGIIHRIIDEYIAVIYKNACITEIQTIPSEIENFVWLVYLFKVLNKWGEHLLLPVIKIYQTLQQIQIIQHFCHFRNIWGFRDYLCFPATMKPVYNDHLMGYLSAFCSSSRWPRAT